MAFWEIVTIGAIGALIRKGIKNAEERAEEERILRAVLLMVFRGNSLN